MTFDRKSSNIFAFDLLLEVFDFVPKHKRLTQRLVSTRWRTAYWGRVESIAMYGVAPFLDVVPMLYCLREVHVRCALTDLPPDSNPCIAVHRLVFKEDLKIPVGALEKLFHMEAVQSIDASEPSSIGDAHLRHCTSLRELNVSNNPTDRTTFPFAASLRKLDASHGCAIDDGGLVFAVHLEELDASDNSNITTTAPFGASLRKLDASWGCGITDEGLVSAVHLEELNASDNPDITTTSPFAVTLCKLDASCVRNTCGIGDANLASAVHLQELNAKGNPNVTTTAPPSLSSLRKLKASGRMWHRPMRVLCLLCYLKELDASDNPNITTRCSVLCHPPYAGCT